MTPPENRHKLAKSRTARSDVVTVMESWAKVSDFENYLHSDAKKDFKKIVGAVVPEGKTVGIRYLGQ